MVKFITIFILLLCSIGCAPLDSEEKIETMKIFPVVFLDDKSDTALELIDHRSERLPSGHVDVMLKCMGKKEKKPIWIDWKVIFYDTRNINVEESEWHTDHLFPRLEKTLQVSSMRKDISSFKFLIRTPVR